MDLKLPPLGEGVDSGTVVAVSVKAGDDVSKGQGVIEIETGKAVAPVPSNAAGKVTKILVSVGDKISVGQSILSMTTASGAAPAAAAPKAAPARAAAPCAPVAPVAMEPEEQDITEPTLHEPEPPPGALPPAAAPAVRRVARELGINLYKIKGSERGGRIVMSDLRAYIARLERLAAPKPAPGAPKPVERIDFSKWGSVNPTPMTQLRKIISQRMLENWRGIPHVTQFEEIDITAVSDLRKKYSDSYDKKGVRLTLTSFALKVVAETLKKFPVFNASIDPVTEEIIYKNYYHIGLAVDTEQGLIVPVLRDVDKKDMVAISKEVGELATKTRDRKVSMEELQGGTFTISNQGGIGGGYFTPIINSPEVAILGMGRGALKAVVRDGKVELRLMLPVGLSYDHRIIDGGTAARFMLDLVQGFEKFSEATVKLG